MLYQLTCKPVFKQKYFGLFPSEWMVNQHRDSIASYIGHNNMLEFFAIAENECKARVKFNLMKVVTVM